MTKLVWFRRDLRVYDNKALSVATQDNDDHVIGLYVITPQTWLRHNLAAVQIDFQLRHLQALQTALAAYHIPLLIRTVPTFADVSATIDDIVATHKIDAVLFNREYEWDELQRDADVSDVLVKHDCMVEQFDDQVIAPPGSVLSQTEQPYKVFTPFKKAWLVEVSRHGWAQPVSPPQKVKPTNIKSDAVPTQVAGFDHNIDLAPWRIGEDHALTQLENFCEEKARDYAEKRDFPAIAGTSQLSPYLAIGVLSPRQCVTGLLEVNNAITFADLTHKGDQTWLSEIIWREFYKHILFHFPEVCRNKAFRPETEALPWRYDDDLLQAWQQGRIGFPLVDAAMRCLNQTGWMHNRLRMVVAMFFTKTLFLDWRMGEKYFMQQLIDGDFASNNGGWQWSASTGTDAAPYFRIFNPTTQSERFDGDGTFIRQYCPELADLDNKSIHAPHAKGKVHGLDYPEPVVDYKAMRAHVIAAFKAL